MKDYKPRVTIRPRDEAFDKTRLVRPLVLVLICLGWFLLFSSDEEEVNVAELVQDTKRAMGSAPLPATQPEARAALSKPVEDTSVGAALERKMLEEWKGDLEGILKRRRLRILVPYSRSYFFHDGPKNRGAVAEGGELIVRSLNARFKLKKNRVVAVFIPVDRAELLAGIAAGRGDIAMGGITITDERKKQIDFTNPSFSGISEVVVSGPGAKKITELADLSGRAVYVRKASSFYESLKQLNEDFAAAGKKPVDIQTVDEALEADDVLEMVNAGLVPLTVVDSHEAGLWAPVLKKIKVHNNITVNSGRQFGIVVRKESTQLKKFLNDVIRKNKVGTKFGNIMVKRYFSSQKWLKDNNATAERKRFEQTAKFFRKYGEKYDFDYLMLAAQGYQESGLNQKVRSRAGAVGVMQLLPRTGKEMNVGDIRKLEHNIHAGAKYLRFMVDHYFDDPAISPVDRMLFAFAAYNAGPTRISKLRREAKRKGLDHNKWFHNVERVVARRVGQEPVRYVSNIYKYYLAYRMADARHARAAAAKKRG